MNNKIPLTNNAARKNNILCRSLWIKCRETEFFFMNNKLNNNLTLGIVNNKNDEIL